MNAGACSSPRLHRHAEGRGSSAREIRAHAWKVMTLMVAVVVGVVAAVIVVVARVRR
jgi:heme/copper-type cytochrome/quinol oxidase subunit 2